MVAAIATLVLGVGPGHPSGGTAIYTVRVDPRLCPSPLCGGYWVALANGARTLCVDGLHHPRCYVARAADTRSNPLGGIPDGALVRGTIDLERDDMAELRVSAVYAPAGSAPASGGFYRVRDTGIRCVRAPCYSYRATQVNGATGTRVSGIELVTAKAPAREVARADATLRTKNGLYARGRFARGAGDGRVFRATRLYLRVPLPRA
jgi:hypothetical protein